MNCPVEPGEHIHAFGIMHYRIVNERVVYAVVGTPYPYVVIGYHASFGIAVGLHRYVAMVGKSAVDQRIRTIYTKGIIVEGTVRYAAAELKIAESLVVVLYGTAIKQHTTHAAVIVHIIVVREI